MDGFLPTFLRRRQIPPPSGETDFTQPTNLYLHPPQVIIPLQDSPAMPFQCLVKAKEEVKAGQKIGEKGNPPFNVSVHATVSGKVREIEMHPVPHGFYGMCVLIEREEREDEVQKICSPLPEKKVETLQQAGIPLPYEKLAPGKVDVVIVNATEFEPNITIHHNLLWERFAQISFGLKALLEIFSIPRGIICLEKEQRQLFRDLLSKGGSEEKIIIQQVSRSYPPTGLNFLAKEVLGKKNGASAERVAFVELVDLWAVARALQEGWPFIEKPLTVSGSGIPQPQNLVVRIGTTFAEVIKFCGGRMENITQIIMGGALMGISQPSAEVPVGQRTEGIWGLISFNLAKGHQSKMYQEGPCIRCAKCVDCCPANIVPNIIAGYARKKMMEEAIAKGLSLCIDCGLCSYVCPARIPLAQILKEAKARKLISGEANF
ncbi:MAG: RnfABCDGE type electron transport complex subunit C [Thermodesulfobacteriota bacterium]